LNTRRKALKGSRVLLIGLAYKPNVDDPRESPSFVLMDLLKERGADVSYFDPHIPVIGPMREHAAWTGTRSVAWDGKSIGAFDATVIATAHDAVNYKELADWSECIIDTRNAMADFNTPPGKVWKA
jgi:UDP-N-acetyl-D-glucosamine dehydrogenase